MLKSLAILFGSLAITSALAGFIINAEITNTRELEVTVLAVAIWQGVLLWLSLVVWPLDKGYKASLYVSGMMILATWSLGIVATMMGITGFADVMLILAMLSTLLMMTIAMERWWVNR